MAGLSDRRLCRCLRALCLSAALGVWVAAYGQSALTVTQSLAEQDGACVVTGLGTDALADVPIDAAPEGREERIAALEDAGLTVFVATGHNVLAIADLRLDPEADPSQDPFVSGSRLLAALPAGVWDEQQTAAATTEVLRFALEALPAQAEYVKQFLGADADLGPGLYGRLTWVTRRWARDDTAMPATIGPALFPSPYFREPPIVTPDGGSGVGRELLWVLWAHSRSPWAEAACPPIPEGDTALDEVLKAAAKTNGPTLKVHPSVGMVGDRTVFIRGQPSSLGSLVWALGISGDVSCRALGGTPPAGGEVFHTLRPGHLETYELALLLPAQGYVSPHHAPAFAAMLAGSDYGRIVPIHACWPIAELPPIYAWGLGASEREGKVSALWVRYVLLDVVRVGPGGDEIPVRSVKLPII